ncbi:type VII secretion protein EccB [Planomonospora sp. ID82291]|uniref:type VII secretion protein EccB n=1 Tax=Planomonospora sp. ID82291 TaxID=2738136 RepID=UPI0018C3625C|nr:type VII secretion protein EccB [Planomonospora sp. ID82291]MBG0815339.1 type VII secretion protein EccB [Planomonospora sp. ID82291]
MQTRRDLYQAYRLMTQRLGTALLQGEPDLPESPMRRYNVAMFCAVLAAVLVAVVFGVLGLLRPGGATALTEPGTVLVEEESGATFVYSAPQRRMIPVANVASARLLLGTQDAKVRTVTSASLARFTRGTLVGIPGAPESLPAPGRLVRSPWSACVVEGTDAAGARRPYTSLIGGFEVGGRPIGQDSAMVVEEGGQTWMLWSNRRMRVASDSVRAMPEGGRRQVPAAWLNALPAGPDLRSPWIPGLGRAMRGPDGRTAAAGRVYTVPPAVGGPAKWYVLLPDGLASLTPVQADLLLQNPATKKAYGRAPVRAITLDAATANATRVSKTRLDATGLPETMPKVIEPDPADPLCAVYSGTARGSAQATLTVESTVRIPAPPNERFDQATVDQVVLPPGSGALVGLLPGDGRLDAVRSLYLIGDQGRRHAIPSPEALQSLGYADGDVAPLPAHLVHLIPEGPALDPAAARVPVRVEQPAAAPARP